MSISSDEEESEEETRVWNCSADVNVTHDAVQWTGQILDVCDCWETIAYFIEEDVKEYSSTR